jgi:hypothetical protein
MCISINSRYALTHYTKVDLVLLMFIFSLEILFRLFWVIFGIQGFIENFILTCISIIIAWAIYVPTHFGNELTTSYFNNLGYTLILFVVMLLSYILERQQKNAFYFQIKAKTKTNWLLNVLDNMSTGFLSIRGDTISYVNSFFKNKLEKFIPLIENFKRSSHKPTFEGNFYFYSIFFNFCFYLYIFYKF